VTALRHGAAVQAEAGGASHLGGASQIHRCPIHRGRRERMGYTYLRSDLEVCQPYDAQKDIVFFDAAGDLIDVPAGVS